ncbi:MAG: DUF2188 domain-containing protein [Candidatus Cloacimonetes bacterium]|nr:DUF2188 domain-containing protein [Candidatus Cloacimonadota bacterium]
MPKKPGSHHVVPNANGGWDVKKDEATRSSGHFDKKRTADEAAFFSHAVFFLESRV